jgi:hypothetical protein
MKRKAEDEDENEDENEDEDDGCRLTPTTFYLLPSFQSRGAETRR